MRMTVHELDRTMEDVMFGSFNTRNRRRHWQNRSFRLLRCWLRHCLRWQYRAARPQPAKQSSTGYDAVALLLHDRKLGCVKPLAIN